MSKPSFIATSFILIVLGAGTVAGQDYPSKTIRIITSSPGGGNDFQARQIAQAVSGPLGQPVIVDNRPPVLVAELTAKAPPDGYTAMIQGATIWITPLLRKVNYEMSDLSPLSQISRDVAILVVHPSLPVKSVKELIALAKARPAQLHYASTSPGAPSHLGTELFKSMAGVNIVHVAYKGTPATVTALISGEVQMLLADVGLATPHSKSGKLRALAVTSAERSALAPDVPTVAASGLPGYEMVGAAGMWFPAKTPVTIVNRLNQEIVRFLRTPEAKDRFLKASVEVIASTPEEFAAFITSDTAKWAKVIKQAGIKVD